MRGQLRAWEQASANSSTAPLHSSTIRSQETRRQVTLLWGVLPRKAAILRDIDDMAQIAERRLLEEGLVRQGKRWLFYYGGADKYVGAAAAAAR